MHALHFHTWTWAAGRLATSGGPLALGQIQLQLKPTSRWTTSGGHGGGPSVLVQWRWKVAPLGRGWPVQGRGHHSGRGAGGEPLARGEASHPLFSSVCFGLGTVVYGTHACTPACEVALLILQ